MSDFTDTVVLYEELAVQDVLPVLWRPAAAPPDPQSLAGLSERNYQILQAWDDLEDRGPVELSDENSPLGTELQRLDRKLSLLLELVGQILCVNQPRPPAVAVRFNALGAEWCPSQAPPEVGAPGTVEIYLRECVAQPLRFAGSVTAVTSDELTVRFVPLEDAVASLIGRIAFRRHRRQIARRLSPPRAP